MQVHIQFTHISTCSDSVPTHTETQFHIHQRHVEKYTIHSHIEVQTICTHRGKPSSLINTCKPHMQSGSFYTHKENTQFTYTCIHTYIQRNMQFILIRRRTHNSHICIHAEHTIDKHTQRNKPFTQKNTCTDTNNLTQAQSTTLHTDTHAHINKLYLVIHYPCVELSEYKLKEKASNYSW